MNTNSSSNIVLKFQEKNSWIVPVYFDNNDINIDIVDNWSYVVYHHFCSQCKNHEKISIKYFQNKIFKNKKYACPNCNNTNFIHHLSDKITLEKKATKSLKIVEKHGDITFKAYIYIPILLSSGEIDYKRLYFDNFTLENEQLKNLYLSKIENLNYDNNYSLKDNIYNFILTNVDQQDIKFKENCKKYNIYGEIKYNLYKKYKNNPNIKDFELLLIYIDFKNAKNFEYLKDYISYLLANKNTKSLRKALCISFNNCIKKHNSYHLVDEDKLILNHFSDLNYISKLLTQETRSLKSTTTFELTVICFNLLKKFYTEKQLFNLYYKNANEYTSDILWIIQNIVTDFGENYFIDNFKKVKCNSKILHDEVTRVYNELELNQITNQDFKYTNDELLLETKIETLNFKLPKRSKELIDWGKVLNNCMGTYCKFVLDKSCIILGVFEQDILLYAIELKEKEIIQISQKSNQKINDEKHLKIIEQWKKIGSVK